MKLREALLKDFDFILKLTRQNMERIVTEEWNADWEKDVEPNFINLWKTQGEKGIVRRGYVLKEIEEFDGELIRDGIKHGSTADIIAAALFIAILGGLGV